MLKTRKLRESERNAVTQLKRLNNAHACMTNHKPLPFPWRRRHSQQMTNGDAIGASMGNQKNARFIVIRRRGLPYRKICISPQDSSLFQEKTCTDVDAINERDDALATVYPIPTVR